MGFPRIMAVIHGKYPGNPTMKMPAEAFFRKVLVPQ
jgi:hypothetical protein